MFYYLFVCNFVFGIPFIKLYHYTTNRNRWDFVSFGNGVLHGIQSDVGKRRYEVCPTRYSSTDASLLVLTYRRDAVPGFLLVHAMAYLDVCRVGTYHIGTLSSPWLQFVHFQHIFTNFASFFVFNYAVYAVWDLCMI